jgi:AraC-like DNA-binding protein
MLIGFIILLGFAFLLYKIYLRKKIEKQKKEFRYSTSNLSDKKAKEINILLIEKLDHSDLYLEADLTLHKLAKSIGVKPNNLSQVINQIHNRNFNEFINLYRLEESKKLLAETYLKIEAVAFDSGFNSLSTFNTFFKKEMGITPSNYRKEQINK